MSYSPQFIIKSSVIAIVSGFIVGYTLFQAQNILNGPIVALRIPQEGRGAQNEVAEIRGEAKNVTSITFNDRTIYTDKNGNFTEKFVLYEGYNVVKVSAKDKFGRTTEKTVELVFEKPNGSDSGSLSVITGDYGKTN
jgi:hypothetical protein